MDNWPSERLSIKIVTIIIILIVCVYFVDGFTIDSVSTVYDNKGNTVAKFGMTKDEIISNMGKPPLKDDDLRFYSCFCYPVSSQNKIKTSFWRRYMFGNYLKIIFNEERAEEIYFFGFQKGFRICKVTPPLAIKINKNSYR